MEQKNKKFSLSTLVIRILPNVCFVTSGMLVTFLIINHFNTAMNFINNELTYGLIVVLIVSSSVVSFAAMRYQRTILRARAAVHELKERIRELEENADGSGE